jgi:RNA polymerase sigma factor (sigma-70 family)
VEYEKVFLEHLNLIDRVVRHIARRHHLAVPDADEFASVVRLRLVDRDYAVLRKFEGRSNLATYLTTVIERFYLDFCTAQWGKWRPSAAARRLGGYAVLLERMVIRDGYTFEEAVTTLHTNHQCSATREELREICRQLPERSVRRMAGEEELAVVALRTGSLDALVDRSEEEEIAARIDTVLSGAIAALPPQDQLILRLRFENDLKIVEIARMVDLPAKPLYRQLANIVETLRANLSRHGVEASDIDRIVGNPAITLGRALRPVGEADGGSV